MDKLQCIFEMVVDRAYKEFTENDIAEMNTNEVGKVADIIKDLAEAMKMSENKDLEETSGDINSILSRASALIKDTEMSAIEKGAIKSKLQTMLQNI